LLYRFVQSRFILEISQLAAGDGSVSGWQFQMASTHPRTWAVTVLGGVTNNGTLTLSSAAGGDLNVGGNFTNAGTYTHNSRTLAFNGASAQTWSNSTVGQDFGAVVINSAGGVTLNSFINCSQLMLTNGKVTTTSVLSYSLTVTDTSTGPSLAVQLPRMSMANWRGYFPRV
jgi:hypothetical protein